MPNVRRIDPKEMIAEVQQLGGEIEQRLTRIFELSDALYSSVRHGQFRQERERLDTDLRLLQARLDRINQRGGEAPEMLRQLHSAIQEIERQLSVHQDVAPVYAMFANAWKRLAGSMHQGLRRTASVGRVLEQIQQKHGITQQAREIPPAPAPATGASTGVDELVELYGEETVNHAASD
jgi:chromosome segregation ATPase